MRTAQALGMVVGCALSYAIYRTVTFELIDSWKPFAQLYATVMGGAVGVMLAAGLILARRWWQGDLAIMSQPGHWLLVFGLAAVLANAGAVVAYYSACHSVEAIHPNPPFWIPFRQTGAPTYPGLIHQAVCWGLAGVAALMLCLASFRRLGWRWRWFFPVVFLSSVYMCAGHVAALVDLWGRPATMSWCYHSGHLYAKIIVVCSLIVLVSIFGDLKRERRGDFLHWTAILSWSIIAVMQLGLYFQCMLRSVPPNQYIGILMKL
jgi:hypothetical protein